MTTKTTTTLDPHAQAMDVPEPIPPVTMPIPEPIPPTTVALGGETVSDADETAEMPAKATKRPRTGATPEDED
jgi:hypothetical protein